MSEDKNAAASSAADGADVPELSEEFQAQAEDDRPLPPPPPPTAPVVSPAEIDEVEREILDHMEVVMVLHNKGCDDIYARFGKQHPKIGIDHLADVVVDVATEIAAYNVSYRVYPTRCDLTKVLAFTATALTRHIENFEALPLFYAYLDFLDNLYRGHGMTLRDFGDSIFYAENLSAMLGKGQTHSPFCFFRAIDLSFERCALRRIGQLQDEKEALEMRIYEANHREHGRPDPLI